MTRLHQRLEHLQAGGRFDPAGIDDALEQTNGLLTTFQALLRIGTVEGGVGRQRFGPVDLSGLMDRIHQAYHPVVEDAGQVLPADHAEGITVTGDAELLAQLFTNLIENAIVHTPPGTRITSRLRMRDGAAIAEVAEVADTGPGVPMDERDKVFRRFYRRDASRSTEDAGLGVALVSAIATLHHAVCTISEAAEGLCVRIVFPLGFNGSRAADDP